MRAAPRSAPNLGNADALGEVGSEVCPQEANSSVGGILARATVKEAPFQRSQERSFSKKQEKICFFFLVPYVLGLASGGDMVKFFGNPLILF